jgi:hypothetical protein
VLALLVEIFMRKKLEYPPQPPERFMQAIPGGGGLVPVAQRTTLLGRNPKDGTSLVLVDNDPVVFGLLKYPAEGIKCWGAFRLYVASADIRVDTGEVDLDDILPFTDRRQNRRLSRRKRRSPRVLLKITAMFIDRQSVTSFANQRVLTVKEQLYRIVDPSY